MIDLRRVDRHQLHALGAQPLRGFFGEAGRVAEIIDAVAVTAVPAGDDDDDVLVLDPRRGGFEIGGVTSSHCRFGIDSTTPEPKKRSSAMSPTPAPR